MSIETMQSRKISLEYAVYAFILVAALAFRFLALGMTPLNNDEAHLALEALNVSRGNDVSISGQPGYVSLTSILFSIFSDSNFFARFWPALIGSLLVLLPVLFRDQVGKNTALILSLLLAFDPFLITISRSANGGIFALTGVMAGIGFWRIKKPVLAGFGFGLALLGGVDLWGGLIAIGLAYLATFKIRKQVLNAEKNENQKKQVRVAIVSLLITLIAFATVFLTRPAIISAVGSSLVEYIQSWGVAFTIPFTSAAFLWLLIQIPVIGLGIWGLLSGIKRNDPKVGFLGIWWGIQFVLSVMNPARNIAELFWVSLPMLILASMAIEKFFNQQKSENRWVFLAEIVLVVALCVFSLMNFTALVNSNSVDAETMRNRIIGTLLPLVLLAVVTLLFAWGWSLVSTRRGFIIGLGLILFAGWFGSSWKAADLGSRPEFEFKFGGETPVGSEILLSSISDLSRWTTSQANRIDIQIAGLELDSLSWALRNFENLRHETKFNPNSTSSIILTPVETEIQGVSAYRGQKVLWSARPDFAEMTLRDWMKWALFRTGPQQETELVFWAKNALFFEN